MSKLSFSAELILSRFKNKGGGAAGDTIPEATFVSFIGRPETVETAAKELEAIGLVTIAGSAISLTEGGSKHLSGT